MTMERLTFNKESSIMPIKTHHHLIFHFYDLPHLNHWGKCSILCSFEITRGSFLVVTHRTSDVQVTPDRPGTP